MNKSNGKEVKRSELWYVNLGEGTENSIQSGRRPCIIVSNDACNKFSPIINIIPLTSKSKGNLPTHVKISKESGLERDSVALAEQIISIDKSQLIRKICDLSSDIMDKVDMAIMIQADTVRNIKVIMADIQRELQLRDLGIDFAIIKDRYNELHRELEIYCELYGRDYDEIIDKFNL